MRTIAIVLLGLGISTGIEAQVQRASLTPAQRVAPEYTSGVVSSRAPAPPNVPRCEDGPIGTVLLSATLGAGAGTILGFVAATGSGARSGFSRKTNITPYIAAGAILGAIVGRSSWQRRCG